MSSSEDDRYITGYNEGLCSGYKTGWNSALERAAQECERDKESKHGLMWGKHFASLVRALKDKP